MIKQSKYLFLFCFFCHLLYSVEISDEAFIGSLEVKLKRREGYIKLLRTQGPEAYIKARNLNLDKEQKEVLVKDLVHIMNQKEAPRVYVDKARKVLVVEDVKGRSEFSIVLLKKGIIKGRDGKEHFVLDKNYKEMRELL